MNFKEGREPNRVMQLCKVQRFENGYPSKGAASTFPSRSAARDLVMMTVHREGRTSQAPLSGSHKDLDPRDLRRVCEELGLDWSKLPE